MKDKLPNDVELTDFSEDVDDEIEGEDINGGRVRGERVRKERKGDFGEVRETD